jgi:integrase
LTCPVLALENWLKIAGVKEGFVLRSVGTYGNVGDSLDKDSVGAIVKKLVRRAKLAHQEEYGGHSLRAGFVTEALSNGASERQVMRQTGHKSTAMVHRYSREDQRDRQSAVSTLGV